MNKIFVDYNETLKKIKPLHGVNNGPKTRVFTIDTSEYFKEANIPFSRLHDTEYPYGSGHFVDIPCIFPNFDADETDPESYDFELTDQYIAAIVDCGTEVFYRLGASIEHQSKKYNIFPPKDNLKWAKICEGIIRHYNEGWANGFHYGIRYWEIWNEPDNHPDQKLNPMWQGTKEQFFELYETAANYLKNKFPSLRIGGYAHCGFYALTMPGNDRMQYFMDFMYDFFDYITSDEHKSPLDFFSWHTYSGDISFYSQEALFVRQILNGYGFTETESILNEWNYSGPDMFKNMKTIIGASCVAALFCTMQKLPVDSAMYYDAQPNMKYCGMFENLSSDPAKTFYSFKAFNELYQLGNEINVTMQNSDKNIYYCAAADDDKTKGALLLVNYNGEDISCELNVNNADIAGIYLIDNDSTWKPVDVSNILALKTNSIYIVKFNCKK